jgi:hypothetical protein
MGRMTTQLGSKEHIGNGCSMILSASHFYECVFSEIKQVFVSMHLSLIFDPYRVCGLTGFLEGFFTSSFKAIRMGFSNCWFFILITS